MLTSVRELSKSSSSADGRGSLRDIEVTVNCLKGVGQCAQLAVEHHVSERATVRRHARAGADGHCKSCRRVQRSTSIVAEGFAWGVVTDLMGAELGTHRVIRRFSVR